MILIISLEDCSIKKVTEEDDEIHFMENTVHLKVEGEKVFELDHENSWNEVK